MFVEGPSIDVEVFERHIEDTTIHTNTEEKDFWNSKLNIDDSGIRDGNLIFTRN